MHFYYWLVSMFYDYDQLLLKFHRNEYFMCCFPFLNMKLKLTKFVIGLLNQLLCVKRN